MKIILGIMFCVLALSACNTVNGMGDDLKGASRAVSKQF